MLHGPSFRYYNLGFPWLGLPRAVLGYSLSPAPSHTLSLPRAILPQTPW